MLFKLSSELSFALLPKGKNKAASFLSTHLKTKSTSQEVLFVLERCVPQAERDAHFVRDVSFGSDVRFAREDAEHITSLCAEGAIHHCAIALHHFGAADTSLFTNKDFYAIIISINNF